MNIYNLDSDQVIKELKSSKDGLTEEDAKNRLIKFGPNK